MDSAIKSFKFKSQSKFNLFDVAKFRDELFAGDGFSVAIEVSLAHQTEFVHLKIKTLQT